MILKKTTFKGVTVYAEQTEIDYSAIGPGLIALVGNTGSGKTSAMETAPASLFREFITRPGSIYGACSGSDAFIQSDWVAADGTEIRVRLAVDAEKRKTDFYIYEDGHATTNGKLAPFKQRIGELFGSVDLFLASVFAAQTKRGSITEKTKSERKDLFAEMLGLARWQERSAAASKTAIAAALTVEQARSVVAACAADGEALDSLNHRRETAAHNLTVDRAAVEAANTASNRAAELFLEAKNAEQGIERQRVAVGHAENRVAEIAAQLQTHQAEPEIIRKRSVEQNAGIDRRRTQERYEADRDRIERESRSANERGSELLAKIDAAPDATKLEAELQGCRDERARLAAAAAAVDDLRTQYEAAQRMAERRHEEHGAAMRAVKQRRDDLMRRTELIDSVPCDDQLGAACPLLKDAHEAKAEIDRLDADRSIDDLARIAADAGEAEQRARELLDAQHDPELVDTIEANETRYRETQAKLAQAWQVEPMYEELKTISEQDEYRYGQLDALESRYRDEAAQDMADRLALTARTTEALDEAGEAIRRGAAAREVAHRTLADEQAKLASMESNDIAKAEQAAAEAHAAKTLAEESLRASQRTVDQLDAAIEGARKREIQALKARADLDAALMRQGDAKLLADACGRDGIQAFEIANAAPEVTEIANDLMRTCFGPRFSIAFETLRTKRDGELAEAFDIQIFDGKVQRLIEDLSGGEKALVGEVIALAVAVFNANRNDIRYRTLWRDETAGALDPETAQGYIRGLRRVMQLGGFEQVIFIAHAPEVYEAADVRLYANGGRIEPRRGGVAA